MERVFETKESLQQANNNFLKKNEILINIPNEDFNKIPNEIIQMLEAKRNKEYKFELDRNLEFDKQNILRETKVLLAILYRDYWATTEERERIKQKWKIDIQKDEDLKRIKYDTDIFKSKREIKTDEQFIENSMIAIQEEKWYKKIFNIIKRIFKRINEYYKRRRILI